MSECSVKKSANGSCKFENKEYTVYLLNFVKKASNGVAFEICDLRFNLLLQGVCPRFSLSFNDLEVALYVFMKVSKKNSS